MFVSLAILEWHRLRKYVCACVCLFVREHSPKDNWGIKRRTDGFGGSGVANVANVLDTMTS